MTDQELLTFVPPFEAVPLRSGVRGRNAIVGYDIQDSQGSWMCREEECYAAEHLEERYHKLKSEEEE